MDSLAVTEIEATHTPLPPKEEFERFGRLPGPVYLWLRRGGSGEVVTAVDVVEQQDASGARFASLDVNRGEETSRWIMYSSEASLEPLLDLKVVSKDEATGKGFIRVSRSLSTARDVFLCYSTAGSTTDSDTLGFDVNVGDSLDVLDRVNKWCVARVVSIDEANDLAFVHFEGWSDKWNEWVPLSPEKVAKLRTHTTGYTGSNNNASTTHIDRIVRNDIQQTSQQSQRLCDTLKSSTVAELSRHDLQLLKIGLPRLVKQLLEATIDRPEEMEAVLSFFEQVLQITISCFRCPSMPQALMECLIRILNCDPNYGRLFARYGVTADDQVPSPTPYAIRQKTNRFRSEYDSVHLIRMINTFGTLDGFDESIRYIQHKMNLNFVVALQHVFLSISAMLQEDFHAQFFHGLLQAIDVRYASLTNDDVRDMERDGFVDLVTTYERILKEIAHPDCDQKLERLKLTVSHRLLTSTYLAKRIFGLTQICDIIEELDSNDPPPYYSNELKYLTPDKMVTWVQENMLIEELLGRDIHEEILKRALDILTFLAQYDALTSDHLLALWDAGKAQHETIVRAIYSIIAHLSRNLPTSLLDVLFERIRTLPVDRFNPFTIEFIKLFTFHAIAAQEKEDSVTKWYGLDLFFELVLDSDGTSKEVSRHAMAALKEALEHNICKPRINGFLQQCIECIDDSKSVPPCLDLISHIAPRESTVLQDCHIYDKFIADLQHYRKVTTTSSMSREAHFQRVVSRLRFVRYLASRSELGPFPQAFFTELWNTFVTHAATKEEAGIFFKWLENMSVHVEEDLSNNIFKTYLCHMETELLTERSLACFTRYFFQENERHGSLWKSPVPDRYDTVSLQLQGLDTLWRFCDAPIAIDLTFSVQQMLLDRFTCIFYASSKKQIWLEMLDNIRRQPLSAARIRLLHHFMQFLHIMAETQDGTVPQRQLYTRGHIAINLVLFDEVIDGKPINGRNTSLNLPPERRLSYLRTQIANHIGVASNTLCIVHGQYGIVLPSSADARKIYEVGVADQDCIFFIKQYTCEQSSPQHDAKSIFDLIAEDDTLYQSLFEIMRHGDHVIDAWALLEQLPHSVDMKKRLDDAARGDMDDWSTIINASSIMHLFYSLICLNQHDGEESLLYEAFVETRGVFYLIKCLRKFPIKAFFKDVLTVRCLNLLLLNITNYLQGISSFDGKPLLQHVAQILTNTCASPLLDLEQDDAVQEAGETEDQQSDSDTEGEQAEPILLKSVLQLLSLCLQQHGCDTALLADDPSWLGALKYGLVQRPRTFRAQLRDWILAQRSTELNVITLNHTLQILHRLPDLNETCDELCSLCETLICADDVGTPSIDWFGRFLQRIESHPILEKTLQQHDRVLCALLRIASLLLASQPSIALDPARIVPLIKSLLFTYPTQREPQGNPPTCKYRTTRRAAFDFVQSCLVNEPLLVEPLATVLEENHLESHSGGERPNEFKFYPSAEGKSLVKYTGIQNPGCICYMNSLIQQMYMVPRLRSKILEIQDSEPDDWNSQEQGDYFTESFLYQFQLVLAQLQESEKAFIDPTDFCYAFKDYDGTPTNFNVQKDTNEFLNMLFDRIDTKVKGTRWEKTLLDELGGTFSNQLMGTGACTHRKERPEAFYCITLNVKNKPSIVDSLHDFVEGEMLSGENAYNCQDCNVKVDTLKRVVLQDLPPTVILHLKRFDMDFNTLQMSKINDRCAFPLELDLFPFSEDGIAQQEEQQRENMRPRSYYQYRLTGVLIHMGSAHAGHYYSFIKERPSSADPTRGDSWFEFNDQHVRPFDLARLEEECFGGDEMNARTGRREKYRNAYLLFYSRIEQEAPEEDTDIVSIPPRLHTAIWKQNHTFWKDRFIYDPHYMEFLYHFVEDVEKAGGPPLPVFRLGVRFVMETLSRSVFKDTLLKWTYLLSCLQKRDPACARWLLEEWIARPSWSSALLLRCPHLETRRTIAFLLQRAAPMATPAFALSFLQHLEEAVRHWTQCGLFYRVMLAAAKAGPDCLKALAQHDTVAKLVHAVLNDGSPLRDRFPVVHDDTGDPIVCSSGYHSLDTASLCALLYLLVSECKNDLSELDRKTCTSSAFLHWIVGKGEDRRHGTAIGNLVAALCHEDNVVTDTTLIAITEGIEASRAENIRPFFRVLHRLAMMTDSLAETRLDALLSALLNTMHVNRSYFYETVTCIEQLIRLAVALPRVACWVAGNRRRFSWVEQWLQQFGTSARIAAQQGLKMTREVTSSNYQHHNDNGNYFGRLNQEKLAVLQQLMHGQDVQCEESDSEEDLWDREFEVGDTVRVLDPVRSWTKGRIEDLSAASVCVSIDEEPGEWISIGSQRIRHE